MTTGRKRLVAVLLAVLMVFSVVPFAALAANAAITSGRNVFSGETITLGDSEVVRSPDYSSISTTILGVEKYSAKLTEYSIDGVIAANAKYGDSLSPELQAYVKLAPNVSISYTTDYSVTAADIKTGLEAAVSNKDYYTLPTTINPSYRNRLKTLRISYSGKEVTTVHLYAKVTPHDRIFGSSISNFAGDTVYQYIGSVDVYPTSIDLKLSYPSTRIATNQTISMIASVDSGVDVKYDIETSSVTGLKNITHLTESGNGVFQITANNMVTSGNRVTVYAFLMQGSSYVYRTPSGTFVTSSILVDGIKAATVQGIANCRPIYDYETVTFSTVAPIESIVFNKSSYTCEVGDSFYAGVTIKPTGATGGVTYTSANPSIATISSSGSVTGVSEGRTTIYATAADGSGITAAATVIVNKATAKISISRASMTLSKGEIATLTATVTPATLTNKVVYWTTSNPAVATVSGGTVLAVSEGTAIITATYSADSKKTATCYVTVTKAEAKITLTDNLSIKVGEVANVGASISETENTALIYASDNTAVAKVDANGNVTGVSKGSAMITVTSAANTGIKGYCIVTVTGDSGIIYETTKYVSNSKYYRSTDVTNADVKTAIAQLKGQKTINVTVDVTSKSDMNKVVFTRYAAARLANYADTLTVTVNGESYVFDSADLAKMSVGRPVYVYTTPDKVFVKYKNASGVYKTIKVTPEAK